MFWSNLVQVFNSGGPIGRATLRLVEGDDAAVMIKRVENLLEDSMKVLKSHERLIHAEEYKTFDIAHRRLLLRVVEVKSEIQTQETRNLFSASPAERQAYQSEIHQLYDRAQIYHRDVLTASRRAQEYEDRMLFNVDENPSSASGSSEQIPGSTTWYSVISSPSGSSLDGSSAQSEPGSEASTDAEPFLAVAHIRDSNEDNPEGEETYRRILIMESKRKRMIMIDPNPCYLKDGAEPVNETSLLEMSKAGETLLRAADPEDLEGYHAIGKQEEPSWVDSMIQSMARLGVGSHMV